ncbi:MAG: helix-turn-helix domain-containing protein, partial [Stellaceae bacterium]
VTASDLEFLSNGSAHGRRAAAQDWTEGELATALGRLEAFMITRALRESNGNRTEAAKRLGIHRQLLYSKAQKYAIDTGEPSGYRTGSVANPDSSRLEPPDNTK